MPTLQEDVIQAIGAREFRRARISAQMMRLYWVWGALAGLAVAIVMKSLGIFIGVGSLVSVMLYVLAEQHLLHLDMVLFRSKGNSKREIFDRHFAPQVKLDLGLRMTEPGMTLPKDEVRTRFEQALERELADEFRLFDWSMFVRQVASDSR